MGSIFNEELKKAAELSKYNKQRASRLLDDMGTAFISNDFNSLDKSLIAVKTAKKAMRAQGIKQDVIDDYFLQRSYLSKTQLKVFVNASIYTDNGGIDPIIENRIANHSDKSTTDLIIDKLKDSPTLLSALQRGVNKGTLSDYYNISSPVLLQNFYNKHKDIIDN